jgi:proteasome lid subunit RPN8/RPN11
LDLRIVRFAPDVLREMVGHAREAAPAECCGLLAGSGDSIVEAIRTRNIAAAPTRFRIDPRDHIERRRDLRRRGLEVVGFYHSHVQSPPIPSERDRDEAAYPDHLFAIVSLASNPPETRVFRLIDGNFLEMPYVTVA